MKRKNSPNKFITALNGIILSFIIFLSFPAIGAANVTSMNLSPHSSIVNVGDIFSVDIALKNSDSTEFDTILVWLTYDAAVLEVQDIFSDPLELYNFDHPYVITNEEGNIDFEEGYTEGRSSTETGVFASILFKALSPAVSSTINFNFNEWGMTPTTAVLYGGDDVLGFSYNHMDGAIGGGVSVNAVPEPAGMFLFLGGLGCLPFWATLFRRRL